MRKTKENPTGAADAVLDAARKRSQCRVQGYLDSSLFDWFEAWRAGRGLGQSSAVAALVKDFRKRVEADDAAKAGR
jgi:hypothetical protein